jgi:16S rRNA (guanine966-N2)-methyltransferase
MEKRRQPHSSQKKPTMGSVRIISGLWKGKKLPVHDAEGLRPTTDRVKETLFNWIAQDVPAARCLDLFAGSGSLGFEAASRQAEEVNMVELNLSVYKQLQTNITALNASNITLHHGDALSYLSQPATPHHIVFIDPPFRKELLQEVMDKLEKNGWLTDDAMIYIESEKELPLNNIPENWSLYREKQAGQVCYRLFERHSTNQ